MFAWAALPARVAKPAVRTRNAVALVRRRPAWLGDAGARVAWTRSALLAGRSFLGGLAWPPPRQFATRTALAASAATGDDAYPTAEDATPPEEPEDEEGGDDEEDGGEPVKEPISELTTQTVERKYLNSLTRDYCEKKDDVKQALLLYRVGDFYEAYFEDARSLKAATGVQLTAKAEAYKARGLKRGEGAPLSEGRIRVPMAGVPAHAVDKYAVTLISKGFSVAICDQVRTGVRYPTQKLRPGESKDNEGYVFRRVLTRVITPGTLLEESMLQRGENSWLAALVLPPEGEAGARGGLAYADVSTGETYGLEGSRGELLLELERLRPAEVLCPALVSSDLQASGFGVVPRGSTSPLIDSGLPLTLLYTPRAPVEFEQLDRLAGRFLPLGAGAGAAPADLGAFAAERPHAARALAAIVGYVDGPRTMAAGAGLVLDAVARRNLDLFEGPSSKRSSLFWALDRTRTAVGARLLRAWMLRPLTDPREIGQRLDAVGELRAEAAGRAAVRRALDGVLDLPRIATRVANGVSAARDLSALAASGRWRRCRGRWGPGRAFGAELAASLTESLRATAARVRRVLVEVPPPAVSEKRATVRRGVSAELDESRAALKRARDFLAHIEKREQERTGIRGLRLFESESICRLAVPTRDTGRVPPEYVAEERLKSVTRYTTRELVEAWEQVQMGGRRIAELEAEILRELAADVAAVAGEVRRASEAVAAVDVLASFAQVADDWNYTRPEVFESPDGSGMVVVRGRHPVVEQRLDRGSFVPNSVTLGGGEARLPPGDPLHRPVDGGAGEEAGGAESPRLAILTGPNASGKSCYLRMAGLLQVMAQLGSWLPADAGTRLPIADRIFTRVGALDELSEGLSTFAVEMRDTAEILAHATPRSLVLVDEVGRGTSFQDGLSIAAVVAAHLATEARCRTLFATHLHELAHLPRVLPPGAAACLQVIVERRPDGLLNFPHEVRPGDSGRSFGVEAARLAGLPPALVARAEALRARLEAQPTVSPAALAALFSATGPAPPRPPRRLARPGSPRRRPGARSSSSSSSLLAAADAEHARQMERMGELLRQAHVQGGTVARPYDGPVEEDEEGEDEDEEDEEEEEEIGAGSETAAAAAAGSDSAGTWEAPASPAAGRGAAFEREVLATLSCYGLQLQAIGGPRDRTDLVGEWRLGKGDPVPVMVQARLRPRARLGPAHVRELRGARERGEGAVRVLAGLRGFSDEAHKAMVEAEVPVVLWALQPASEPPLDVAEFAMNAAARLRLPGLSVVSAGGPARPSRSAAGPGPGAAAPAAKLLYHDGRPLRREPELEAEPEAAPALGEARP
eukprot:tig00000169_g11881.t1